MLHGICYNVPKTLYIIHLLKQQQLFSLGHAAEAHSEGRSDAKYLGHPKFMYIFMYVCMYVCMYACANIYIYIFIYLFLFLFMIAHPFNVRFGSSGETAYVYRQKPSF